MSMKQVAVFGSAGGGNSTGVVSVLKAVRCPDC
jgi:hypothetical protein